MRSSSSWQGIARLASLLVLIAGSMVAWAPTLYAQGAAAQDVRPAIHKASLYIELTERPVDSWYRYLSWINVKTGGRDFDGSKPLVVRAVQIYLPVARQRPI